MKKLNIYHLSSAILPIGLLLVLVASCKHEIPQPKNGNNSGSDGEGVPCDPNVIYYQQQIQPLLTTYCAKVGNNLSCHHAQDAQDGVILDNYNNVMATGEVTPFDLGDSDLWEVLNETDPDKQMPPPGEPQLTQEQMDLIRDWILQGAQNLSCDEDLGPCDSTTVSFSADVMPIMQSKCYGCHVTANAGNNFVALGSHSDIVSTSLSGDRLMKSIRHEGLYPMPKSTSNQKLSDCSIAKIGKWVADGAPNN